MTQTRAMDGFHAGTIALGPTQRGKPQLTALEAAIGLHGICRHVAGGGYPPDYCDPLDEICARYGQRHNSYVAALPLMASIVQREKTRARQVANHWRTLGGWWPTC